MDYIFSKEEALKFNHIIEEIYESENLTQCYDTFLKNISSLVVSSYLYVKLFQFQQTINSTLSISKTYALTTV